MVGRFRPAVAVAKMAMRVSPRLRRMVRRRHLRSLQPDWRPLLRGQSLPLAVTSSRVLIPTSVGAHLVGTTMESTLAAALSLRGAEIHVLLCDADLPACSVCTLEGMDNIGVMVRHGPRRDFCPGCFDPAADMYRQLGVTVHRYGDHLTDADRAEARELAERTPLGEIGELVVDGAAIGEHAHAGALRFYARAAIDGEPASETVRRRYLEAALLVARATRNLLASTSFDVAVFHHGIYVPQGVIGAVAREAGVPVVNWNPAYRSGTFVFSHGDTYHHTLMDEPTSAWENMHWDDALEEFTLDYLESRRTGVRDWITFVHEPNEEIGEIEREVGIDLAKPTIGMLTNVMWDAQLHYPANAFPDMRAWALETVRWFADHPDLQLLIRVHPAEVRGILPSRQPIVSEIDQAFPTRPSNVFVISPESRISTYAAMARCDSVLIYGTKTGVELTAMGIPVITAGEAWIRNKGLTMDAHSRDEYLELLNGLPIGKPLDEETTRRARKYAFHFFFRRMISLGFVVPTRDDRLYRLTIDDVADLGPGRDAGLDVICDGILRGSPFVHEVERTISGDLRS